MGHYSDPPKIQSISVPTALHGGVYRHVAITVTDHGEAQPVKLLGTKIEVAPVVGGSEFSSALAVALQESSLACTRHIGGDFFVTGKPGRS